MLNEQEFAEFITGDRATFRVVYDRTIGLAQYVATRCGLDPARADDVIQEAFVRLYQHRKDLRSAAAIKSWLCTTVRNLSIDQLRRGMREVEYVEDSNPKPCQTQQTLMRELEIKLVGQLVTDICTETGDDLLKLFYVDGLSAKEIANRRQQAISTITTNLSRARNKYRERLREHIERLRDESPF